MTRPEIESQLRLDNPTTTDDLGNRHGPGSEVYESAIQRWADAMEAQSTATARETARAALAEKWAALPAWIRGPYGARYAEVVRLLDANDDDAAIAIVEYAAPPAGYDEEKKAVFDLVRADLLAALQSIKTH